jgi:hypothetical protein
VLLFSRRRKVLQAVREAVLSIREQSFSIKQETTRWLGFWLDSKLSFGTHFENRMASVNQGSSTPSGEPQQKQWWPVRQFDTESRGRGSHLGSTIRLRSLAERPARQSEQATAVAEQPIKRHYGPTEIDTFSLPPGSSVLALRKGTPRLPTDQIRDASAQRGRRSPDPSIAACQRPTRRALRVRRSYSRAVKHRLGKAREDTSAVREQACAADCETRRL